MFITVLRAGGTVTQWSAESYNKDAAMFDFLWVAWEEVEGD